MTVAVCHVMPALDVAPPHTRMPAPMPPPEQLDMWGAINGCATKPEPPAVKPKNGYPMATVRRSMSQESLSLCTESLGCETGTRGDFLDLASLLYAPPTTDDADLFSPPALQEDNEEEEEVMGEVILREVQYHRARPQRAFPPPLPSMSRRGGDDAGPCLRVRPHRRDGRLVLEAVAAKPQGYLHAQREGGRLKLCFVDCSSVRGHQRQSTVRPQHEHQKQSMVVEAEEEEEEEEDEVEVVDRGTVVEVVAASGKAQRCSRIVINKFVGGAPATTDDLNAIPSPSRGSRAAEEETAHPATPGLRRVPSSTTTLAAAVAAASTGMQPGEEDEEDINDVEEKSTALLFTSRVGDREELVQSVRRCRQLRQRPLFIVEPYSIVAA
ncbi:protein FAF-like, chloroplastic [Hordeum vulgare subsp. vulgare]|uniref:protein FAF-like, chloroplastic n=1 Tax=Hordeum vulgare subsp. vulgare TaxID=112509 RepID=UPI000B45F8E5|nr:protein FAF-like, chloroplastic [Hordeum vulgare subsp. vulgare]